MESEGAETDQKRQRRKRGVSTCYMSVYIHIHIQYTVISH